MGLLRATERHITLDRTMWGTDHAAFRKWRNLVDLVRKFEKWVMGRKIFKNRKVKPKKINT